MAEPTLADLVAAGCLREVHGDAGVRVRGVRHDSRKVDPGDAFVALAGARQDGTRFIRDAIARGAVAVVVEQLPELEVDVPVALVDDGLRALADMSRRVYDDPTAKLQVIGITGTNGKTTTAYLVEQALLGLGHAPAVIGTVDVRGPFGVLPATHTTPMADDLMRLCRLAANSGATHLVLEVSSHGLSMRRADGVSFDVVAFTNLSQDHLDYHGDLASYAAAKRRLFTELPSQSAVVNVDDAEGVRIAGAYGGRLLSTSRAGDGDAILRARVADSARDGIHLRVETPDGEVAIDSPLLGAHNADNLLTALGCLVGCGVGAAEAASALGRATGAPGRMQRVAHPHDVLVFVDYAHTPDAVAQAARTCRALTDGRLFVVFGCGGDRDRGKRPRMAAAAGEVADLVVVTSDNPRSEDPEAIVADVMPGLLASSLPAIELAQLPAAPRGHVAITDRRAAIRAAIAGARPGDTVLIAGKGHERVQIVGDRRLEFDDVAEASRAIASQREVG